MGRVRFPQYRRGRDGIEAFEGTLLEHARKLGVKIASECGGLGACGRCTVRIEKGAEALCHKTVIEKSHSLAADERLACQARVSNPESNIPVFIRDFGDYAILSDTLETRAGLPPLFDESDTVSSTQMQGTSAAIAPGLSARPRCGSTACQWRPGCPAAAAVRPERPTY